MSEPFPADRITGPDYISVADARKAIMKAREEGRLEGLEEAAKVAEARDLSIMSMTMADAEARKIAAAIRALKEKQP